MIIFSNAKINLTLKVNSKTKNNLHEIQSLFCLISLKDKIKIIKIKGKKDKIIFNGPFAKYVNKSNNSILNLLKLLRNLKVISHYFSINITKNIPVFGGLGGGTGNAAFILNHILKKKISRKILDQAEKTIGTDLRLFFYKIGYLNNLNKIVGLKKKQKFFFLLVHPKIKCSTKEIFSKVRRYSQKKRLKKNEINTNQKFLKYLLQSKNDLQSIVEKKYPKIKGLLSDIRNVKGCYFSRMTGSGSVCYGLFKDQIYAKKALNKLKTKYPNFWFSFAKTV